ncbi:DinB family protein [Chitinophaga pendula]|uniref:hypothetical protein n=1 Tax=Chitinophaga TaxID=79328 RepID=UPI000BAF09AB|nr:MULTISPECIES: hypothetical protein [Chitinophaga]ASZ11945.1 hypothetical protein CK934_13745 [Chitinophaga sp. MD30]UCJ05027.1 DinB family protein [Chitinophaga pendula]
MKQLTTPIASLLSQILQLLEQLTDKEYSNKIALLSDATIGQHIRHIIEFYLELNTGYASGIINYDKRKRDHSIEVDRTCAINKLQQLIAELEKENISLILETDYSTIDSTAELIKTDYMRELAYNLEHTVHHMALIRVGIYMFNRLELPKDFGVAISTIKYRSTCAQ